MKKATKTQIRILNEFKHNAIETKTHFYLAKSDWTSGSGRFINKRPEPKGAQIIALKKLSADEVNAIRERYPRVKEVIAISKDDFNAIIAESENDNNK